MKKILLLSACLLSLFFAEDAVGQSSKSIPGPVIICPPGAHAGHSHVPMPKYIADKLRADVELRDTEDACAEIIVNYTGFSPEAEAAFEYAKTIWENALVSTVPIVIDANWTDLGENALGSAGPANILADFTGAPDDRWYPIALANQFAGSDLAFGGSHILANFNSEFDWYLGTDGNTPTELFDFVSVVLHEIGHGLGFTTLRDYDVDTGVGTLGFGTPTIFSRYDDFLLLGPGGNSLTTLGDGTALGDAMVSDNIYSGSSAAILANGGTAPRYYAPVDYAGGSSIAHWDESDFPAGNIQSLMTPQIGPAEAIHNPGPITLGLFEDMGWELCQSLDDQPCTTWQDPSPTGGYTNFNTSFGGAPCDDGGGCPFNEIQGFEVWAGEAYSINNFIEGGSYTFSICNGPGAGSWVPDFTIIAPSGAVDAFGSTTSCSITWTASESGTYLIVINEEGNCGDALTTNNGWPAITCSGSNVACVDTGCETPSLVLDGPATICQDQTTTVDIPEPATFPDGGGIRLQFISTATGTGINLTLGGGLPYTFDYDLNGLLSANDIDPFEGEYTINIFLFTDAANIAGTICASGENPVTVTFLGADDPLCDESAENCSASPLIVEGDSEICAGETTTLTAAVPPEIPVGGGMLYQFVNVDDEEDVITWTGAPFPATFDNDLNGLLSDNDIDPFSGTYEVEIFIFTNPADIAGSICAFGNAPVTLTFLDAGDPLCQEPSEPCTDWQDPAPGQGWPDFNNTFGGAPCDDGGGCPFNEIQAFQVWAGEAYAINNFIEGGTYTFSNCNGPGAGSWVPEFTVIAPSGAVDAFGSDTDCSITWTASESGTYLIVINEAGNCGDAFNTNNGWPAITCEGDGVACEGAVCETPSLVLDGPATICQDQTTTVDIPEPATFPDGGGIRLQFISTATGTGINLTLGGGLPYTFDYDLNGLLSANDIDPFEGEYTINIFLFTDADDIAGTICASGEDPVTVTFLGADDPLCEEPSPNCSASPLIIEGPAEICEGETVTLTGAVPPEIPAGGSMLYQFVNVDDDEDVINWTGAPFPATFDNDLNGLLSDNDFDPFSGTYEVEIFVYSNPGDIGNSTCAFGGAPVLITFLDANDPLCDGPPDPCSTAPLLALGSVIACEGESLTVAPNATFPPEVPEGGGIALVFAGGGLSSDFIISEVDFPFTFDADLNGALSGESLDPLSGDFEVEIVIYTDPTDVEGSICAEGTVPVGLTFAGPDHPDCVGEPEPCTDWQDPTPSTGYSNFNDLFGGAPCDPGTGCPVNEIITIEVWAGEAYSVDNFQEGGTYTFSICNGPGAFSWMPDFTIIAPSGAIDAFGSDTDCSITWTASESGTYLIVINQFGNCGEAVAENNGYPSLTCEGGPEVQCPETCDAGTLGVEGETALCPGDVTTVFNTEATEIPAAGGYRIRATADGAIYFFAPAAPDELTFIEYTFDGQAATPFVGTATLRAQVYSDADNPEGSICAESSDIELTFLADNAEDCTLNSVLDWLSGDWSIYPNPAGHFVTVDLSVNSPLPIALRITDISGRTVHTEVIAASSGRQEIRVETSQLASGIYVVSLEADNARDVKRLAVQH